MRTLLILFILTITTFAQVIVDSSKITINGNITRVTGWATFINTPTPDDYDVGFFWGVNYDDLNYIPMGDYSWSAINTQLTFWTDVTNLPEEGKYYYAPWIMPKSLIGKFEVGSGGNIICEPVIEYATGKLNAEVGEQITFTVYVTEYEDISCSYNYAWSYMLATLEEVYDSNYIDINPPLDSLVIDTTVVYNYPETWTDLAETTNSYTTPTLDISYHKARIRCRVYNGYGEAIRIERINVVVPI